MNCREAREYLDDLLIQGINPASESALAEHGASCARCRRAIDSARQTLNLLHPSVDLGMSTTLKESIMKKIEAAEVAAPYMQKPSGKARLFWKPAIAAAAVVVAIVAGLAVLARQTPPVYALEQTIEANQSLRTIHMRMTPQRFGSIGEIWARFDGKGELVNLRMNFPDTDDGPKDVTWADGKAQVWFKKKGAAATVKEPKMAERIKQDFGTFDPKKIVEGIYRKKNDSSTKVDIKESSSGGEPIVLTVTTAEAADRQDVYRVDPKTKLLLAHDVLRKTDGAFALEGSTEYLDYNKPIADSVFALELPENTLRIDETTQEIGLAQGTLSNNEIAMKVVREFFTALINKDYAMAGQLYGGYPAEKMKALFGKTNFTRIISVGEPTPSALTSSLKTPCKVEVVRDGKTDVWEPYGPFVRQVYNQPDRWEIIGGI